MANPFSTAWRRAEAVSRLEVAENDPGAQAIKRGGGKRNLGEIGKQVVTLPEREEFLAEGSPT
jgi:hypothetical protein